MEVPPGSDMGNHMELPSMCHLPCSHLSLMLAGCHCVDPKLVSWGFSLPADCLNHDHIMAWPTWASEVCVMDWQITVTSVPWSNKFLSGMEAWEKHPDGGYLGDRGFCPAVHFPGTLLCSKVLSRDACSLIPSTKSVTFYKAWGGISLIKGQL